MSFTIQWSGSLGPATTSRDSPIEAIRFAIEMLSKGFDDVTIVDPARVGKVVHAGRIRPVLSELQTLARMIQRAGEAAGLPFGVHVIC